MSNRNLSKAELKVANHLLASIRRRLVRLSEGDPNLLWAYRRKVYKELCYDERGKPMVRRILKALKRQEQKGRCAICKRPLPERYAVLDRKIAMRGYTVKNTRLIHQECDAKTQTGRGWR